MEVVVLSDTHLRQGLGPLAPPLRQALRSADLVLHAGDVTSRQAFEELSAGATVRAVLGNNDHELGDLLPETAELDLEGVRVAMVHDAGPRSGRRGRLHRRFPDARLVVFGHSHVPVDEEGLGGQWLFNPGSPTQRRRQPHPSYGWLHLSEGRVLAHRIEALPRPSAR